MSDSDVSDKKRINKQIILNSWGNCIHPEYSVYPHPPFRKKPNGVDLRLVGLRQGLQWVLHKGNGEITPLTLNQVERKIATVVLAQDADLSSKDIREIRLMAELMASKNDFNSQEKMIIPETSVAPVRTLSCEGWCYKRLDFDPDPLADSTIWETETLPRIKSNLPAFLAWVGSLFDPTSNREKYLWIWGKGETGKSSICEVLLEMFGDAAAMRRGKKIDSNWFTSTLVGIRLCHLPEAKPDLVGNGEWKTLTGERYHEIERKGEQPQTARIDTKFMITSNDEPHLPHGNEHLRRIILIETERPKGWVATRSTDETMDLLRKGLPWLLSRAIEEYQKNPKLTCDTTAAEEIQEENPSEVLFNRFFIADSHATTLNSEIRTTAELFKRGDLNKFIRYCIEAQGCVRKQLTADSRGLVGLRRKYQCNF